MDLSGNPSAASTLDSLFDLGLLTTPERESVESLATSELSDAVSSAETIHLHFKVDNTDELPINEFFAAGASLDHQKAGFVKYRFPGGINAIFSHIKVSQDELMETDENRRERPFLDHVGIDMREESEASRALFDRIPELGAKLDWGHAPQGGDGAPVYCCHVEVAEKHWLYPTQNSSENPPIPLEFAFGALKVNPEKMGCDLRPSDPRTVDPDAIPCCGTTTSEAAPDADPATSYYRPADLGRFGEIGRESKDLAASFFDYYGKVMADGALTQREKSLIALAAAHALKCPYCIDSISNNCLDQQISEPEMMEAVHVAAAMAAGVSLVHSTQMLGHIDQRKSA